MKCRLWICENLSIVETKHPEALQRQPMITLAISFSSLGKLVNVTVHLDYDPPLQANEIRNKGSNRNLAPEPVTSELSSPEHFP
ncbi:MAG: hypothetical protein WC807_19175 [Hyphomicrobium sp.]|jgi:hypothetical protein